MIALIGGATAHSWGCVPAYVADAAVKVHTKGHDGDLDELYLNAFGMRWISLDEISTLSLIALELLDAHLRQARCRHPYVKIKRRNRLFGGINIISAGDFLQLPRVRSSAIYSNPWKTGGYGSEEQKILKMLWVQEDEDSIQQTFLLTEPTRTNDPWLRTVLDFERCGEDRWEMYCVMHGFLARNVGSWLPGLTEPMCKHATCAKMFADLWPQMWRRSQGKLENSKLRQNMQCKICQKERPRRCCVLQNAEGFNGLMVAGPQQECKPRYLEDPYASAPYVHPLRHPSFFSTQLRAIIFAKAKKRRLL